MIPEKGKTYWFVMLRGGMDAQYPLPMLERIDREEIALFASKDEAIRAVEKTPIGIGRGYEVYEWEA